MDDDVPFYSSDRKPETPKSALALAPEQRQCARLESTTNQYIAVDRKLDFVPRTSRDPAVRTSTSADACGPSRRALAAMVRASAWRVRKQFSRLRVVRTIRHASQAEVAVSAGMHPTRHLRLEQGIVEPSPEERAALARTLDVDQAILWPTTVEERQALVEFIATEATV
jgi:hypothetical protein